MQQHHPIELLTVQAACRLIGGDRPIHPATYYRGIRTGLYPAPVRVGPNTSRVVGSQLRDALVRLIEKNEAA